MQRALLGGRGRLLVRNTLSLLASDVLNRGATFVLYVLVGRYLGPREFGQFALALTFFYVFQVVAGAGLKVYVTRQVAKDPAQAGAYLVSASAVAVAFSLLAFAATVLVVLALGYSASTARPILLLALGLLPFALAAVCEGVLQGREEMHYIVWANAPVNAAKVSVALVVLASGSGLYPVVAILVASYAAVAAIEWLLVLRRVVRRELRLRLGTVLATARGTSTFLGIDALVAVTASMNVILLSKLESERAVGLYGAAAQLLVPLMLVYQNTILGVFPLMARSVDATGERLRRIVEQVGELLLGVGLLVVVPLFFLAEPALRLLYGNEFEPAGEALRVVVWSLLLSGLTTMFGQVLYARLQERTNLRLVVVDAAVGVVAGFVLIDRYGVVGAAVALLVVKLFDFGLHYAAVARIVPPLAFLRMAWKPVVAAACTALFLASVDAGGAVAFASGTALYAAVLGALSVWSAGGLRELRARYVGARWD
jgi:O-antigen/teichoic acid export membrane protein